MSARSPRQLTLPDVVCENARRFGTRTALVDHNGRERLSFEELPARMWALAAGLRAAGVGRGDCIASVSMNRCDVFEALLAVSALGASLAPLNWRTTEDEMKDALEVADPAFTLYEAEWQGVVSGPSAAYEELAALRQSASPLDDDAGVDEDDAALRLFTAAFSGRPRAADLSQRALLSIAVQQIVQHRIDHQEVFLNSGPMFHVGNWIFSFPVFLMGGTNVVPPRWDAQAAAEIVERERVTRAYVVPPMGAQLLDAAEADGRSLSSIRSGVAFEDRERWYAATSAQPAADVMPYGQTEVTGLASYQISAPGGPSGNGTTLPLVRVAILDPDGAEVLDGGIGEIAMRGPTVMLGYAGDDAANAERFDARGWYRTGDLGRRGEDGSLHFAGPMTEIIKSGAENIYPVEVENALRGHPAVADVCVIGVPDERWGAAVKAVLVLEEGAVFDGEELIGFCRERIASYKKPRDLLVVAELPKSGPFVDRDQVHALYGEDFAGEIRWSGGVRAS